MKAVLAKLCTIQTTLKAPKGQFNSFGNYNYRSCEDIMEGIKPLLASLQCVLAVSDKVGMVGERYYIEATATLYDCETGESFSNTASAREEESKKGMDSSQVTGATSSYARKYALNGLLAIDDTKDSDATNEHGKGTSEKKQADTPAEAEAEIEKIKAGLINKVQIASIEAELKRTGIKTLQITINGKKYEVNDLSKLNFEQWKEAMDTLETVPDKKETDLPL